MRAIILPIVLVCLLPGFLYAEPLCTVDANGNVSFGSGKIELNFTHHRSDRELRVLETMVNDPSEVTADVLPDLEAVLKNLDTKMGLTKQLDDADRLKSGINSEKVKWVGVEFSREEVNSRDSNGRDTIQRTNILRSALVKAGATPDMVRKTLLLYAGSPARYLWNTDQDVRNRAKLVPLDNDSLKQRSLDLLTNMVTTHQHLEMLGKLNPSQVSTIDNAITHFKTIKDPTDDELKQIVKPVPEGEFGLKSMILRHITSERDFRRNQALRDKQATKTALTEGGSGWISFGTSHKDGIETEFKRQCAYTAGATSGEQTSAVPSRISPTSK